MTKVYLKQFFLSSLILLFGVSSLFAQQVPNASFEDWSGPKFDGKIQPKDWYGSNISQAGLNFNLTHQEAGHTGSYSMMVKDTKVGALGITEVSPGYFSLGKPWSWISGLDTKTATAGTSGGINFKYRPDTMSVWIKRTGANVDKEDFYLLYYAWSGTAKGSKYKAKSGNCSSPGTQTNEESDIRQALDANECGTDQKANQIAEGMWREKKEYGNWTNIKVPIYYFNNDVPTMMNIIFSASNYPNYRANDGLYDGNSLYVDDVELIYSSKIQKLYIGGKEWKGFDPNTTEEQVYSLGRSASSIPEIKAVRGAGSLTNVRGESATFSGRELSGSEISIQNGEIDGSATTITVKSEDGKSTTTYKIKFVRQASTNAKLANILVNGVAISNFQPALTSYNIELPFGTTDAPIISAEGQEDEQVIQITQPSSPTGTATINVTAADGKTKQTYTLKFSIALLSDNTLKDIKINGESLAGYNPNQTTYRVSLPTSTTSMPIVEAISAYPAGAQTIEYVKPTEIDGGVYQIHVSSPGNPTPKTYKLNFKLEASSYSMLKDLQMGDNWITNFTPENLTYYVNLPVGTTEVPEVSYTKGESTQTVEVIEGGLDGVTRVIVTAGNGINTTEYKIVVSTAKSEISTLNMIYIGGEPLENFDPNVKIYTYALPIGTTELPTITVDKGDEYQTVNILPGSLNGTTRITVTAQNGESTIYEISFSVTQATNASLKMIYLDGKPLDNFDPDQLEYTCPLPQGTTTLPVITYDPGDEYQTITVRSGGINGDYKITVRPPSGTSKTYVLHFSVITSDNINLQMIYLDGDSLEGFSPDKLNYIDSLPMGVSTIPTVTYEKGDDSQKILSICTNNVHTITVTSESGRSQTYTITFIIQRSQSAFLKMIYLNGDSLQGFDSHTFAYTFTLTEERCPIITVDKEEGQQITISTPYAAGQAKIEVKPQGAAGNTYTIDFENIATKNTAQLEQIYIDGNALEGFQPNVFDYNINYFGKNPIITCDTLEGQQITLFQEGTDRILYVVNGEDKAQYQLHFAHEVSNDCLLADILINGETISGYAPEKKQYTIQLQPGQVIPTIEHKKRHEQQSTQAGMIDANTYNIFVRAESGDTTNYTLHFDQAKYSDATLLDLVVDGYSIDFEPTIFTYSLEIAEYADLPSLHIVSRAGQHTSTYLVNADEQNVIVIAENGNTNTYRITYTRTQQTHAYLQDILVDGQPLANFRSDSLHYVDTLAWRSTVVPCVQPIGYNHQTITTYHSAINGTTRIHVLNSDGSSNEYTIQFPVRKSSNVALDYIEIDDSRFLMKYHPDTTDYVIYAPYQETNVPLILYAASEPEQQIQYISRPLGQTSQLIVTAEDGSQRTYNLTFLPTLSEKTNVLQTLKIKETGEMLDPNTFDHTVAMPYGSKQLTVEYTKSFAEQTVMVQPGGVNRPTTITVKSNRKNEANIVYTITPELNTQNPAVLKDLTVNGVSIDGFDPNRFTYIVNITKTPSINYAVETGVTVNAMQTLKHWQAQVTCNGYTNTYEIWFHYPNDKVPNTEFSDWSNCLVYTSAVKPTGWNTIADALGVHEVMFIGDFAPDGMVKQSGNAVQLTTPYSTPGGGNIPGFITLGSVSGNWGVAGSSSFAISGGISFHNTPDQMHVKYYNSKVKNHSLIQYSLTGMNGVKTLEWKDSETRSDYKEVVYDLSEANNVAGDPSLLNITLCSFDGTYGKTNTSLNTLAEMYIDHIRFTYNNALKNIKVNGDLAQRNGNNFTYTLSEAANTMIPSLEFIGEVSDQAQKVVWNDEVVSSLYAERTATITNYAEDGTSSEYTLTVKRPLESNNRLKDLLIDGKTISGFNELTNTYEYHIPSSRSNLPDVQPIPTNHLQNVIIKYSDSTYTVSIKPEHGPIREYKIRIITDLSNDTQLNTIVADGVTYIPEQTEYTVVAEKLPTITFVKKMDGQTVDLNNGILTVTAEDGTQATYSIVLEKPVVNTIGELVAIEINGLELQSFSPSQYEYTLPRPQTVAFKRTADKDSVIFIQDDSHMEWIVIGTEAQHTYKITYPTELSNDATIHAIKINQVPLNGFNSQVTDYTITTDSTTHTQVTIANTSSMTVTQQIENGIIHYTYNIVAEDGTSNTYQLHVQPNITNNPYLSDIRIDGFTIPGFQPDSLTYTIILPTGSYKSSEPIMPSIQYTTAAPRQQVSIETGNLGETTNLIVSSEDNTRTAIYQLFIQAEPSHNAELTGIAVNGSPIEQFEKQRHYYSTQVNEEEVNITWSSEDNFQDITLTNNENNYIIHVVAQDGVTASDYTIEVYQNPLSNNATLNNILIDGMCLHEFEPTINQGLEFSPMQQRYAINLPSGSEYLPELSAQLSEEGQQISIDIQDWVANIIVTAPDQVTTNTYRLTFAAPMSSNAHLQMIYINGDSLDNFSPEQYNYFISLPIGETNIPNILAIPQEAKQTLRDSITGDMQHTIYVTAEDGTECQYMLAFTPTQSNADTLKAIYADGILLDGFRPDSFYYAYSLPVGTQYLPELSWDEADEWQTVTDNIITQNEHQRTTQIDVLAMSGRKNTYTIAYEILKSDVDTLQMIYIKGDSLEGFNALQNEYNITLAPNDSTAPNVAYREGDLYQNIQDTVYAYMVNGEQVGWKYVINVTAQSGSQRYYTLYFTYAHILSTNTQLKDIYIAGESLQGFSPEQFNYIVPLSENQSTPSVLVEKNEYQQQIQIEHGDTTRIIVTAEDIKYKSTYMIIFQRQQSPYSYLDAIYMDGNLIDGFRVDSFEYDIKLPFGTMDLPVFTYDLGHEKQNVQIDTLIATINNQKLTTLRFSVTAPDPMYSSEYDVRITIARNDNNRLKSLTIHGDSIEGFHTDSVNYTYTYPIGTDSTALALATDIQAIPEDSNAVVTVTENETDIIIQVTAADGTSIRIYTIHQIILRSSDATLKMIVLDSVPLHGFLSDVYEYTYYVVSNQPTIQAVPTDSTASIEYGMYSLGEPFNIYVTAADGTEAVYTINFIETTINSAASPNSNDVLFKHFSGTMEVAFATIRKNVSVAVYDAQGHRIFYAPVPEANQNDAIIIQNATGTEELIDTRSTYVSYTIPIANQCYFYVFYENEKRRISSGKFTIAY